jgi:NhaP-type Na+/H+ or K+/H+ antiporter
MTWQLILLVFAFVLFILAALNIPSSRVNLGWAGMACLTAYWLLAR